MPVNIVAQLFLTLRIESLRKCEEIFQGTFVR